MKNLKKLIKTKKGLTLTIMLLLTSIIGISYGTFVITTNKYKASELLISELNYGITIEEDETKISTISNNEIEIPANGKNYFNITISSVNKIDSKYTLAYTSDSNIEIEYTDKTSWTTEGMIKGYDENTYNKTIRIIVHNKNNETKKITFKVFGGYTYNSYQAINLGNGYKTIAGPYKETLAVNSSRLVDIIENDTKCITNNNCKYQGGSLNNYIQYPENKDKTKNLWRIIGTNKIDNKVVAKIISTNETTTTKNNINASLTSFYNTLTNKENTIYKTNKFNCNEECTESSHTNIGLISTYEYNQIGGLSSYLNPTSAYFSLNGTNIENITPNGIEETTEGTTSGLKPVVYLSSEVKVTGSGTIDDPYVISDNSDINIISYTYKGATTSMTYKELVETKYVSKVTCKNGTKAEWDETKKMVMLTNVQAPEYCTIDFTDSANITLYSKILEDHQIINIRPNGSFDSVLSSDKATTGIIYKERTYRETGGNNNKDVYYFAGNVADNWVEFGGYMWRIIRTNEDGGIRLLYHGTSSKATDAYISSTEYNLIQNNTMYVGYMYGSTGSINNNRTNTTDSNVKKVIDNWYKSNIFDKNYDGYVSKTAIYCNDRASGQYRPGNDTTVYAAYDRLLHNRSGRRPSYQCGQATGGYYNSSENWTTLSGAYTSSPADIADRFSVSTESGGNGKLQYGVALMTADEIAFAGGLYDYNTYTTKAYFFLNDLGTSSTNKSLWRLMSPYHFLVGGGSNAVVFCVKGDSGNLTGTWATNKMATRPVLSLKSCVAWQSGDGTAANPYKVTVDSSCSEAVN